MVDFCFLDALNAYSKNKTPEVLAEIAQQILELEYIDRWSTIVDITESFNRELKLTLAEIILWSRPAIQEEEKNWYSINGRVIPVYGELSNNCGDANDNTALAKLVFSFWKANPDRREEITALVGAGGKKNGFYGNSTDVYPDSEASIYSDMLPTNYTEDDRIDTNTED